MEGGEASIRPLQDYARAASGEPVG